jgi:hypothetical protein
MRDPEVAGIASRFAGRWEIDRPNDAGASQTGVDASGLTDVVRQSRSHGLRQPRCEAHLVPMRPHFLAFRRTLPGGMIVLVSLEIDTEGEVHGILQVERRLDPARQLFATAPVVARASGRSKDDVLRQLRTLAENDAELAVQIAVWEREHPGRGRSA